MSDRCLFCGIVSGEVPADIVAREDGFVAFHDISPKAPVHLLVIPEHHVSSVAASDGLSADERAAMLPFIARIAARFGLNEGGYRVTTNHGPDAHQSVFHLHWHILGGARLSESM
ncbi:MAG TPA: HIT domain-containing protein [Miltoncostaeaceae bacterium]|nr:HIT domain-containing protein [Miltoncostaeaceae bacterium]